MTQKELLYVEDAVKHEKNMASVLEESINYLEDEELVSFFEKEIKKHNNTKDKLIELMEEKTHE